MSDQLDEVARQEIAHLWHDFDDAIDSKIGREPDPADPESWSISMHHLAERIAMLTRLVGSPPWGEVGCRILLGGWWEAVHRHVELDPPEFPRAEVQASWDRYLAMQRTGTALT